LEHGLVLHAVRQSLTHGELQPPTSAFVPPRDFFAFPPLALLVVPLLFRDPRFASFVARVLPDAFPEPVLVK